MFSISSADTKRAHGCPKIKGGYEKKGGEYKYKKQKYGFKTLTFFSCN